MESLSQNFGSGKDELARFDSGGARKIANTFRWGILFVTFLCGLGGFWVGVGIFSLLSFALLVVVRGLIVAHPAGVYVRNIFSESWHPWNTIERFEARSLVRIVGVNGDARDCIAVQRANISVALGRVSRVDRAVSILEKIQGEERREQGERGDVVQNAIFLSVWEWLQILSVPLAALLGFWVSA